MVSWPATTRVMTSLASCASGMGCPALPITRLHQPAEDIRGRYVVAPPLRSDLENDFSQGTKGCGKLKVSRRFFGKDIEMRRDRGVVVTKNGDQRELLGPWRLTSCVTLTVSRRLAACFHFSSSSALTLVMMLVKPLIEFLENAGWIMRR